MPVSRRRKRIRPSRYLGLLRGSGRSEDTIAIARSFGRNATEEVANWTVRHLQAKGPLQRLRPRRLSGIYDGATPAPLPIDQELIWANEIVVQNSSTIKSYLGYKLEIESALCADQADRVFTLLDGLEAKEGYSLFSIATRIAALQLFYGLEAQKEYLAKIRTQNASPNIRFFSYWWSVRCEDRSSWANFQKDFSSQLKRWSIDESFRAHIGFEVLRRIPAEGQEASLICGSYLGTAIDVYETILAVAETCLIESRSSFGEFLPFISHFSSVAPDPRTTKLLFLTEANNAVSTIQNPELDWRNALVSANPTIPSAPPRSLEEIRAAAMAQHDFCDHQIFAHRIAEAFSNEVRPEETARNNAILVKLGAMFDHLSVGGWLAAIAANPHLLDKDGGDQATWRRFIHANNLEPEILGKLPQQHQSALRARLPSLTIHPYVEWIDKLAVCDSGQSSNTLNKVAKLQLDLIAAVATREYQALIRLGKEYESEVGFHSHLSLNALMWGELGLYGVPKAACFVVDQLLQNPHFAAWLPIEEFAIQALAEDFDQKSIDLPILLHFAANIQKESFSSERTYAVEDYLSANGALKPTDLLERIKRDQATSREVFFFRECCSVSSMRISTLFQNETELEDERIAICHWLIEQECDQAEVLAEEARELVRGRLVRQGLKELEGSKLSIDSAGLRVWADRVLREDYGRYIDFLETGLFTVNDDFKEAVLSAIETDTPDQSTPTIPDNEGASLLGSIVTRAIREFALHSEHGLDAYLSLRIRHGTLSGHLRGPIEELNIITRRRSDGSYLPNEYWIERLGGSLPPDSIIEIDNCLTNLSRHYDTLIERLTKDLIQVRTADKPSGLIPIEVSSVLLAAMLAETNSEVSFEDFMVRCEDIFWLIVSSGSGPIRAAIDDISNEIHDIFDGAERSLRQYGEETTAQLRDSLVRGKGIALTQLEKIQEWLQPPTTQGSVALDVEALINVSLSVIRGFYNTFQPNITLNLNGNRQLQGAVRWFSDVFFIIFENVLKYSGNSTDPDVEITFDEVPEYLSFKIVNSVDDMSPEHCERIERARERIQDGSFRTAVRSEGGTGLPKLAKVIGYGKGGELDFGYDEESSTFEVRFKVRTLEISEGDADDENSDR